MTDDLAAPTAALVRRAQAGDVAAFGALAARYGRAVRAIALAHLRRPGDADDVAQDALLAAFARIGACREPARFDGWLFAIARNRARRALVRRRLRDVLGRPPAESAAPATGDRAARAALLKALATLPVAQRELVLLHDLEGHDHAELARALGITEETSRQRLARARRALRAALEEEP